MKWPNSEANYDRWVPWMGDEGMRFSLWADWLSVFVGIQVTEEETETFPNLLLLVLGRGLKREDGSREKNWKDTKKRESRCRWQCTVGGDVNWYGHHGKRYGGCPPKLKLPYNLAIPLLGTNQKKEKQYFKKILALPFTVALSTIARGNDLNDHQQKNEENAAYEYNGISFSI